MIVILQKNAGCSSMTFVKKLNCDRLFMSLTASLWFTAITWIIISETNHRLFFLNKLECACLPIKSQSWVDSYFEILTRISYLLRIVVGLSAWPWDNKPGADGSWLTKKYSQVSISLKLPWGNCSVVIFEPSILRLRCFIAAGQFAFPFYLSFDQALPVKQCSPTLKQSAQFAPVGIALRGILGST